jgi:integrase
VKDVEHEDIERLHRKITKGGTPYRANRVAALLGKMFALAVKWKLRANNPVAGLEKNPEAKRTRYMTHEEVARLSAALAAHRNQEGANVIRLLLLTGARRGEVMKAQWSQFDLAAGVWTKPGATTKQKTEHRVPLSGPALQLLVRMREDADAGDERAAELEEAAAEERRPKTAAAKRRAAAQWRERKASPYLFPGDVPGEPVNNIRRFWEDIVERAELQNVRIHDLRHSYASFLASAGHSLPIIGALLGHTQAQTTQRYAHLLDDPLRQATERVGAIVAAATAGTTAKVLPLKRVR